MRGIKAGTHSKTNMWFCMDYSDIEWVRFMDRTIIFKYDPEGLISLDNDIRYPIIRKIGRTVKNIYESDIL